MSADALLRIEYKLNHIISALKNAGIMMEFLPQMEEVVKDVCEVCRDPIRLNVNTVAETVEWNCGCKIPIRAIPGISKLTQEPVNVPRKQEEDSEEPETGSSG